jgi:class 3 adenylate cyclase
MEEHHMEDGAKSKPIADLFPETTIMFADIAGFTAWSSTREPSAVFTLLEAIYAEFDSIAKRRRVFKVEVVGDCYVAVAGLPDPRPDHAVVMAKFANDCLTRMFRMVRKLEVELGPDTAELGLRVGLHSGPVVAGVLRGDKSRFQLFGDTVSTMFSVAIL